jgi:hypothetical protein
LLQGEELLNSFDPQAGPRDRLRLTSRPNVSGTVSLEFTLHDGDGATATQKASAVWVPRPDPPQVTDPRPADKLVDVPISVALNWSVSDPDPDERLHFTVLFGESNPPQNVITTEAASIIVRDLVEQTQYL